jgi:hypothetical protein
LAPSFRRFPPRPRPARVRWPSRVPPSREKTSANRALSAKGAIALPPGHEVSHPSCRAGRIGRGCRLLPGVFSRGWRAPRPAAPAPAPVAAAALTPAAPRMSNAQTSISCGPSGIDEESALPIAAIASRRLFRPIGARPHRLIERVSGRVTNPGDSHPASACRASSVRVQSRGIGRFFRRPKRPSAGEMRGTHGMGEKPCRC